MHEGEAEAFVLHNEYGAKAILTDDGELIKLCRLFEIPFINALAIITRMFESGCKDCKTFPFRISGSIKRI